MSNYKLDINRMVDLSDYSSIHDYMGLIGVNDKFIISFDNADFENAEVIADMLKHNNFIVSKGENNDGKICISARRNK